METIHTCMYMGYNGQQVGQVEKEVRGVYKLVEKQLSFN